MSQDGELERLRALDAKIAKAKADLEPPKPPQDHHSMAQTGWRMVIELVTGLALGAAIGYGIDVLLGTLPLFLVILTLLGFAAGVQTMMRTSRDFAKQDDATPDQAGAEQGDDQRGK